MMDAAERAGRIMIDAPRPTPGRQPLGQAATEWDRSRDYIAEQIRQAEQAARQKGLGEARAEYEKTLSELAGVGEAVPQAIAAARQDERGKVAEAAAIICEFRGLDQAAKEIRETLAEEVT